MKKPHTILAMLMLTVNVFAQTPKKMSYQAVIRNTNNALVSNQAIGMQISILQTTATGTAVYVETQTPTTNANGLVSLEIGAGTAVAGTFASINWTAGPYYIKTETDPNGGTNYTITGTSQLMSVPYAFHAKTAESVTGPANKHYVGELFGGGIVYYVYDNGAHGLIASLEDLDGGNGVAWSGNTSTLIGSAAKSYYDGASNTAAMVAQDATPNKAGTLCNSYTGGGFTDWYLPSNWELHLLYNAAFVISDKLANDGDNTTQPLHPENAAPTYYGRYWSSNEENSTSAWNYSFYDEYMNYISKSSTYRVRAVRAF